MSLSLAVFCVLEPTRGPGSVGIGTGEQVARRAVVGEAGPVIGRG